MIFLVASLASIDSSPRAHFESGRNSCNFRKFGGLSSKNSVGRGTTCTGTNVYNTCLDWNLRLLGVNFQHSSSPGNLKRGYFFNWYFRNGTNRDLVHLKMIFLHLASFLVPLFQHHTFSLLLHCQHHIFFSIH